MVAADRAPDGRVGRLSGRQRILVDSRAERATMVRCQCGRIASTSSPGRIRRETPYGSAISTSRLKRRGDAQPIVPNTSGAWPTSTGDTVRSSPRRPRRSPPAWVRTRVSRLCSIRLRRSSTRQDLRLWPTLKRSANASPADRGNDFSESAASSRRPRRAEVEHAHRGRRCQWARFWRGRPADRRRSPPNRL